MRHLFEPESRGISLLALSDEQQQDVATHPEFEELVRRLRAGELTGKQERLDGFALAMNAKSERDDTNAFCRQLDGLFHKLRMQATCVDGGNAGEVLPGPSTISADTAELPIIASAVLLGFIIKIFLPGRSVEFAKSVPQELSGQRLLEPLAEIIQRRQAECEAQTRLADQGEAA